VNMQETAACTAVTKAVSYLEGCGFRILDRDWHSAGGMLSVIAVERHTFVAFKVLTRSGRSDSTPVGALSRTERRRLRRLAAQWLTEHGYRFDQIRIDVIRLRSDGEDCCTIEHVRGAT
jgi:putative endonuclease